ncbi:MAG: hypothetical protein M1835_006963, partial [Candelina submexicana]
MVLGGISFVFEAERKDEVVNEISVSPRRWDKFHHNEDTQQGPKAASYRRYVQIVKGNTAQDRKVTEKQATETPLSNRSDFDDYYRRVYIIQKGAPVNGTATPNRSQILGNS